MEEHTADIRNVNEDDTVVLETTEGEHFEATCTNRERQHADPRSGEIRETTIWEFDAVEYQPVVSILQGLKSSPDDPDFPVHREVYDRQQEGSMGYIESVDIVGKVSR